MSESAKLFVVFITGVLIGAGVIFLMQSDPAKQSADTEIRRPLYWVAPMDANYRRDKPGKSPMGMDLIPVYEEENAEKDPLGTVKISPNVINNLGVRTAKVEQKSLHAEIVTVGYVKYDEDKLFHIHPRVSGWVDKLYVKAAGDPVTKGEPLYSLYSPELVNAQDEFLLAINRSNARLTQAAEDRLGALQIPKSFIEKLKKTRRIEQTITFYAPQTGVVDNLNIREGFYVQPGTTMLSVGSLSQVWVEAEVFERQASMVRTNDPVAMTLDYLPGKTWKGRVDYIYPTLDTKTRTVRIRLRFENPEKILKPNMFAQVTIYTDSPDQVLVVPRESLIRTGQQDRVVLALGEGKFRSVKVNVGRLDNRSVEILEGLKEGQRIVTSAQFLLDSESSKSADFTRMNHGEMGAVKDDAVEDFSSEHETSDHSKMDHSNMDHSNMDHSNMHHSNMHHSNMHHSNMDHSNMDHSGMNHSGKDRSGKDHSGMDHSKMEHPKTGHSGNEHGVDKEKVND
ncbi:Cation efflux system protein CusB [Thalassocella blandensis]|nr:Cation efflux system protein CusB [Thalassocella blandensis]